MKKLRDSIAELIEKNVQKSQHVVYNLRDEPRIETEYSVFLNLADAIIPMVKTEFNKKRKK